MRNRYVLLAVLALATASALAQTARTDEKRDPTRGTATLTDGMRGPTAIADEPKPPPLGNADNRDVRRERSYPMQPPTIPHKIDNYQVDRNVNACLSCHSRGRATLTQAIPVSVTHYMDRDGNFLAEVSPRRYFCEQCHVTQVDAKPLVETRFEDVDDIIRRAVSKKGAATPAKKK